MLKTKVTIWSDSSENARIDAAGKLGVEPDEVVVESVDGETYTVAMLNVPGQVDIVVSDRNMNAAIRTITPSSGSGKPLKVEDIENELAALNIVFGINRDIIENVVSELAATGIAQNNIRIAAGQPAKDGIDARIEFKFSLNNKDPEAVDASRQSGKLDPAAVIKEIVSGGHVLAIKIPSEKRVNGSTVTGETLLAAEPRDKTLQAGANVTLLEDNSTYIAAEGVTAGYADYVDGSLCVDDPIEVSEDKLSVRLSVHPPSQAAKMLTLETVGKMLTDSGITHGINQNAIEQSLQESADRETPIHDTVIAESKVPEAGEAGRIEFKFQTEKIIGTIDRKSGAIDYRERHALQNVKAGEVLAVNVPPTKGKEGFNVYGDVISADPETHKFLIPGENVKISGDGLVLTSAIDGVVVLTHDNKVRVLKHFKVAGDVDYSTGNLSMEGTLDIKGWIRSKFHVRAKGEILVGAGIEDANVEAGANISINGGIIGSGEGKVHAGGNLTVRFIENAQVHANGDILIHNDIVRSNVLADGSIIDTGGKGRIRGGSVSAGKIIEMDEIGSPVGIITQLSVGVAPKFRERFLDVSKKLTGYRNSKVKADKLLAKFDKSGKGKTMRGEFLHKLETLNMQRRKIVVEEKRIVKERKALSKKLTVTDGEPFAVKVKGVVYSGTIIFVSGYAFEIKEDIKGKVTFILDEKELAVKMVR